MGKSFKQWLQLQELAVGSDPRRNGTPTQTAQATSQVAQSWLSKPQSAQTQAQLATGAEVPNNKLANTLVDAGAQAVQSASPSLANQTTAPAVANFLQNQFQLPNVVKTPPADQIKMMKKRMGKK